MREPEYIMLTGVKFSPNRTGKALLVEYEGEEAWVPLSQVEYFDEDAGDLSLTRWIAEQKGFV